MASAFGHFPMQAVVGISGKKQLVGKVRLAKEE
jgi:hypothetical protein